MQEKDNNRQRITAALRRAIAAGGSGDGAASAPCSLLLVVDNAEDALQPAEVAEALCLLLKVRAYLWLLRGCFAATAVKE